MHQMSLVEYLKAAPKAELHVHLEGSIRPATLLVLAQRNGVALPADTEHGLREWFKFRDFAHFIEIYIAVTHCLKTAEDYELVAYEFGAEMARHNVRYAEVTFTPSTQRWLGVPHATWLAGLNHGRQRAHEEFGVELRWIFDIVRSIPDRDRQIAGADYTTRVAIECQDEGVVALGLGGLEAGYPAEDFARWFDQARAAGLHSVPHAGETAGPQNIWASLRSLGAERIGHGVRAIDDPKLVAYLAEHHIPLEVCPTSNLRLGIVASYAEHPLRRLFEAGVPITVNSDDPALFATTLTGELALLSDPYGLDAAALDDIILNGVRHAFLPASEKAALVAVYQSDLGRLKAVHL
jgi:aminodeoxyfutalosine deaminase